ncbi:hypothetical protein BDA96_03G189500 [Sorghum bicolor]|uniref:Uncharacterized protein n=1 Tax=Sorghum bicolor TaxID=4558 RepID=A0A921RCL5_SORBI|nr:hypothetical protein BDA96_K000400 [Sorghum bicolor]KAG0537914.1 hypothetical protein BDA96_03G189500 [Sorghum bicolor]
MQDDGSATFMVSDESCSFMFSASLQTEGTALHMQISRAQQEEIGDGANLTISFAGELLEKAEELIRMGLHPSKIIIGYTKAETAGKESSSCGLHRI